MFQSLFSKFRYFDFPLLASTIMLALFGIALLFSVSISQDQSLSSFYKQLLFLAFGLGAYLFFSFFDYHTLAKANRAIYVVTIIILIGLLLFAPNIRGGRRWLPLGLFSLQVAEFAKVVVILGLARLLHLRRGQINSWPRIFWSLLYAAIPAGLIILEPDLGSALVILAVWAGVLLISPIEKKFIIILLALSLTAVGVTWKFFLKDFQRDRILVFIDPELDPKGRGYNVRQAAIAVGNGQLLGNGLGKGAQTQNRFLPEQQTDFIFAASAEQIGFVGSSALLLLFVFLLFRLISVAKRARDDLGMYIAGGTFFLFLCHILVNVGMNIGLLPVTGIPLPFISAGGSSLAVCLITLGIVQNVAMQSKTLRF